MSNRSAFQTRDVDVVILNYRVGALAAQAAYSARENGTESILIVDNKSDDESLDILEKEVGSFVDILQLPMNVGFSSGNNAGAQRGKKPLILFMNPDVSLDSGALQKMVDLMNEQVLAGIVGPSLYGPDGEPQASAYFLLTPFRIGKMLFGLDKLAVKFGWPAFAGNADLKCNGNYSGVVESLYGACLLVRRKTFDSVNGFDGDYFLYCEETDFCLRLRQAGWKAYRCGTAKAKHWHGQSAKKVARKSQILMSESHQLYAQKHFSCIGRGITSVAFIAGLCLRILFAQSRETKAGYYAALGVWMGWTSSADPRRHRDCD